MKLNNYENFLIIEYILEEMIRKSNLKNIYYLFKNARNIIQKKHNSFINVTTIENLETNIKINKNITLNKYALTINGRELNILVEGLLEDKKFKININKENNDIYGFAKIIKNDNTYIFNENIEKYNASIMYKFFSIYYNFFHTLLTKNSSEIINFIKDNINLNEIHQLPELIALRYDKKIELII